MICRGTNDDEDELYKRLWDCERVRKHMKNVRNMWKIHDGLKHRNNINNIIYDMF